MISRTELKSVLRKSNGPYTSTLLKKPKYRNKITQVGDEKFDSKFEASVWADLQIQERVGEISDLRRQVRFPLVVNGQKVCDLVLDFVYTNKDGVHVYADAKSEATRKNRAYAIKKKLFKAIYGRAITEFIKK